jgi:hypothetical protein
MEQDQDKETEIEYKKLGDKECSYLDILDAIARAFRQEVRRQHETRKNVVPTKYILPSEYIIRLLNDPDFKRCWEKKVLWWYYEGKWFSRQSFPNIGGVPVEQGAELQVLIARIPRRTRGIKKKLLKKLLLNEQAGLREDIQTTQT